MKKVTLIVPDAASDAEIHSVLMDALFEFVSHRGGTNAETYVNKRYPDTADYAWLDRKAKIEEVQRRTDIAMALRRNITVEK